MGLHASPASDLVFLISHEALCSSEAVQMVSFCDVFFLFVYPTARGRFPLQFAPDSGHDPIGRRLDAVGSSALYCGPIKPGPLCGDSALGPASGLSRGHSWMGLTGCPRRRLMMTSPLLAATIPG